MARALAHGRIALVGLAVATGTLVACKPPSNAPSSAPTGNPTAQSAEFNLTSNPSDEPMLSYVDQTHQFRFIHPAAWARSNPAGEAIRVSGRDQFMSVAVVSTPNGPLEFAATDAQQLAASTPGFSAGGHPKSFAVAGTRGALLDYIWQAGPSPVTGKPVPSTAKRYYIPGPAQKLAVFTYTGATSTFDREDADDFANTFVWL
jgi:hypothetical protein